VSADTAAEQNADWAEAQNAQAMAASILATNYITAMEESKSNHDAHV